MSYTCVRIKCRGDRTRGQALKASDSNVATMRGSATSVKHTTRNIGFQKRTLAA